MANSVDPDETLRSAASHLGLYCLLRPVCPNTYGKYGIYPKYWDTILNILVLKFEKKSQFYYLLMSLKKCWRVANSVDPESCILWQLIWVYTVCSGQSVPKLRVIMVKNIPCNSM